MRGVGVSFIVFISLRSFIILSFAVCFCLCASDWSAPLQTSQICIRVDTASLPAASALRLSCLRYDLVCLIRADQPLRQERFGRLRDCGDVLAMILPRSARSWTAARRDLVDAAPV
jgi:hypothetical protein